MVIGQKGSLVLPQGVYDLPRCVTQLFIVATNACNDQLIKREDLFWFTLLEVSKHDEVNLWFYSSDGGGSVAWQEQTIHLIGGKHKGQRKKKGLGSHFPLPEHGPQ